jgi:hypothetical protein
MEAPEVFVRVKKNGVFLQFPLLYMTSRFGPTLPDTIRLICGGREVEAKLYMVYRDSAQYRIFAKYVPVVLDSDECIVHA